MITNGFTYMALLLFMAAVLVTLEKSAKGGLKKFFKFIPAVVLCYLIAMLLCTLKVWDLKETKPAYSALKNNLTYAMIFAMLLRCDIRKVLRLAPRILVGYFSAIHQAKAAAAGVGLVAKKPNESGKAITFAALVETYAILALLVSILAMNGLTKVFG